ncbi:MAG TPA: delta-60 repeat domain-containing protein [Actinomycetota bacterium]
MQSATARAITAGFLASMVTSTVLMTPATAAPGTLDRSFSLDGRVTTFPRGATAWAVAIDAKGRILVAGTTLDAESDIALARLRPNGNLDPDFGGGDGRVTTDLGGTDYGSDIALGPGGRIVVVGQRVRPSGSRMAVAAFGPRGRLDANFSRDGIAFVGFDNEMQGANAVAIGANGKIVIGGSTSNGLSSRWALARLEPRGVRDRDFGGDGRVTLDVSASSEAINDLAIVGGGKVVAVGPAESALTPRYAIARFLIRGAPDRRFGKRGVKITDIANGADTPYGVTEQEDGKLLVVGHVADGSQADWGVVRYGPKGRLDDTFHGDGVRILRFGPEYELAQASAVQSNGRIVVVGRIRRDDDDQFGIVRLKTNGDYDRNFSDDGRLIVDFDGGSDTARDVALQANGRIVAAGEATDRGRRSFGVVRLLAS